MSLLELKRESLHQSPMVRSMVLCSYGPICENSPTITDGGLSGFELERESLYQLPMVTSYEGLIWGNSPTIADGKVPSVARASITSPDSPNADCEIHGDLELERESLHQSPMVRSMVTCSYSPVCGEALQQLPMVNVPSVARP